MINIHIKHEKEGLSTLDNKLESGLRNGITDAATHLERKIVQKVLSNISPTLKSETIARKGSSKALIDTGELFDQIDADVDGLTAKVGVIGSRAKVAVHHEYGAPAAGIPERSFIRSTFNEEKRRMGKIIEGAVKDKI